MENGEIWLPIDFWLNNTRVLREMEEAGCQVIFWRTVSKRIKINERNLLLNDRLGDNIGVNRERLRKLIAS